MSPCDRKLLLLLQGECSDPVSGVEIGRVLGVTRAAVWKRIRGLRLAGYKVKSVPRRGYVLEGVPDLLIGEVVGPLLGGKLFLPERYHFFPSLDSTNEHAARMAAEGAPEGTVIVADSQVRGRGRLGRTWESPAGVNLYFSMILRPPVEPRFTAQMTLISGLALAETVSSFGIGHVEIKWPNDLLLEGGKLAGILTEMSAEADRVHHVVVGVGLNVNASAVAYSPEIGPIARSLGEYLQKTIKRASLLADFLFRFEQWYGRYLTEGFESIREAWIRASGVRGKLVRVNLIKESFSGLAVDMDRDGFLLVRPEGEQELKRVIAGDVTPL